MSPSLPDQNHKSSVSMAESDKSKANVSFLSDVEAADHRDSSPSVPFLYGLWFCIALALPSLLWVLRDKGIWWWDQSSYGSATVNLWTSLSNLASGGVFNFLPGVSDYFNTFLDSVGLSKAPGIALVGQFFVPLGQAFGNVDVALLFSIVLESFLVLLLVFEIGRKLSPGAGMSNRALPFLGCLGIASLPLFFNLSRSYLVEMLQALSVVYFYWLLVTFEQRKIDENAGHLMIAAAIGLFAKVSTPLYCVVPGFLILLKLLQSGLSQILPEGRKAFLLWCLGVLSVLSVATWYGYNWQHVAALAHGTSIGQIAELYGQKGTLVEKLFIWLDILHIHMVMPLLKPVFFYLSPLFIGAPIAFCLYKISKSEKSRRFSPPLSIGLVASVQAVIVMAVLMTSIAEDPRYAFGVLPSLVVAFMAFASYIKSYIYFVPFLLLFGAQFVVLNLESFGYLSDWPMRSNVVEVIQDETLEEEEIERLSSLAKPYFDKGYMIILGVSYHWLNVNTGTYTAKKLNLGDVTNGTNESAGQDRWSGRGVQFRSWTLSNELDEILDVIRKGVIPKYIFISLEPSKLSGQSDAPFANKFNKEVLSLVTGKGTKLKFDSKLGIVVYKVE